MSTTALANDYELVLLQCMYYERANCIRCDMCRLHSVRKLAIHDRTLGLPFLQRSLMLLADRV